MKSRITISALIIIAAWTCCALCMAETTTQMTPTAAPTLKQVIGTTDASLGPTRYPSFYHFDSDNPTCGNYLKEKCTDAECLNPLQYGIGDGKADTGMSLAPLWLKSINSSGAKSFIALKGYETIPDLKIAGFQLADRYRNSSKMLVTWTVRIEGYAVDAYNPWPTLCRPWHGTSWQQFPGGQVHTRLYVNGAPMGTPASMSIPGSSDTVVSVNPHDPTLSGSCLLSKNDFGTSFPEKMDIEVKWYNDTCMKIKSPAKMRNLTITTVPITTDN